MELSKVQITKLGEDNWVHWKFRMLAILRGTELLVCYIVEGKMEEPSCEAVGGPAADGFAAYKTSLKEYLRNYSTALLLITNNISDQALDKVMRFTSKVVWDELHRLYESVTEDHLYDVCLQFFRFSIDPSGDMAPHISKLKKLWHNIKRE